MFSKVNSICLHGLEGKSVLVEADVSDGLPGYSMVGYLASEVREAQDRVRTAIRNLKLSLPPKKVTINLSPADLRKEGTGFDLAIAAAILIAYGAVKAECTKAAALIGELGLDGKVKGISGVLTMVSWAKEQGYSLVFLPKENQAEASLIDGISCVCVDNLWELYRILKGEISLESYICQGMISQFTLQENYEVDFSEVNGQAVLRRAVEVAAAGKHNLLMIGPAGSGKSMTAKRIPTILPAMDLKECMEISKLYSVAHLLSEQQPMITKRPFRAPHHTISHQSLIGGGMRPKPGEISLANGGVLFLDELAEMHRQTLEALRQPLEEREVTISRVYGTVHYPANFQLIAAMNPCPCGHYPDLAKCSCTPGQIKRYLAKISRPLLERFDLCVEAAPMTYDEISDVRNNEPSSVIRSRVERAREIQRERLKGTGITCNSEMNGGMIREYCHINIEEREFLKEIFQSIKLSARMYDKLLKVSRTIADLDGREEICHKDLCETISYARIKEKYWN